MIYPATPLHIAKYSKKKFCFISETRDRYETIVRPYIEKNQLNPQWVYNIIDGKSEQERVLLKADQFILLPTWTWDGKDGESMHLLALVKSHDIHSIRDLRSEHIPLLETVLSQTTVRFRLNYQSSFCRSSLGVDLFEIWSVCQKYSSIFPLSSFILSFTCAFHYSTQSNMWL